MDFEARSRSSRGSGDTSGDSSGNSRALVPAMQGDSGGVALHPSPNPMSPQHLSSFIETPVPQDSSSSNSPMPLISLQQRSTQVNSHTAIQSEHALHLHHHQTLNQANLNVSCDPAVIQQAQGIAIEAAREVERSRSIAQGIQAEAAREVHATRVQAQGLYVQAQQEVQAIASQAEQEVLRARELAQEAENARAQSEHRLSFAQVDFERLHCQLQAMVGVVERQRDMIQRLEERDRARTQAEAKFRATPSNGTAPRTSEAPSGSVGPLQTIPEMTGTGNPQPESNSNPKPGVGPIPESFLISTPRNRTDPIVQEQLDALTAQVSSLAHLMQQTLTTGRGDASAPSAAAANANAGASSSGLGAGLGNKGRPRSLGSEIVNSPPDDSSSSSSSSKPKKGRGGKDNGNNDDDDPGSSSSSSSSSSSDGGVDKKKYKNEKRLMRVKGYDTMKIPAIPKNAAEARGFRNAVYSSVTKLAKGDESDILSWIGLTHTSQDASDFDRSGNYPLLDRLLGHKLLDLGRGTKFSLDFQALQESSQKIGKQPRGRLLLWYIFQKYKMEKDKGTALTQHHLLSLTMHGSEVKALEDFRQRFNYIYEALEVTERPTEASIRSLLFEQMKGHPKMALHIDRYRNASVGSSKHTWRWLYNKMCEVIEISQLEENADAIDKALKPKAVPANPAPKSEPSNKTKAEKEKGKKEKAEKEQREKEKKEKQKEKKKEAKAKKAEEKRKEQEAAAAAAAPSSSSKGKGKGGNNGNGSGTPKSPRTKEQNSKIPCMFWAYDCCHKGKDCEYLHDKNQLYKGPKPKNLKPTAAGAATVLAGMAAISTIPGASGVKIPSHDGCKEAKAKSNGSAEPLDSDSRGKGQPSEPEQALVEASWESSIDPESCLAPLESRGIRVKVLASKVQGKAERVAKRMNASMLPKGGVFQKRITTIMAAMAAMDPCSNINVASHPRTGSDGTSFNMEFLVDSGAGRNLVSQRSIPEEAHSYFSEAPEKLRFSTGGGPRSGTKAVRIKGEASGDNVFYSLKDCPPALSVGIQVNEHKKPWVWFPDQLPFFIKADRVQDVTFFCPESAKIYADRVDQNVPIMSERVTCGALPSMPSSSAKAPPESSDAENMLKDLFGDGDHTTSDSAVPSGHGVKPLAPPDSAPPTPAVERPAPKTPARTSRLEFKPDSSLPKFGHDDELSACIEPVPGEGDKPLDEEDAERHPEWSPTLRERLIEESRSLRHALTHYPKNRYCEVCRRAKMTAKVHRSRGDPDPEETPPLHFGHRMRVDHIILGQDLTKGSEGEQACLVAFDEYSGCYGAIPQSSRAIDNNISALRKFGGTRAHGKALCNVKSDAAPELVSAIKHLDWLPDPGVPNDPFHNANLERAVRSIKEGTRAIHLKAGFPHDLWPRSIEYFCVAHAITTPAPVHPNETPESKAFKEGKTCYEVANGTFEGYQVPLGALVYYKPPNHKDLPAFSPRTFPGIFCGWRMDAGYKFRGVHMVLDYESLRKDAKGCGRPIQVYASELIVPETFVFPLHEAQVEKLALFRPEARLPSLPAKDVLPFESGAPEPKVRTRRTYVTLERAIRFGKTVGCKGCDHIAEGVKHTDACHERFRVLLETEKLAKAASTSSIRADTPTPSLPIPVAVKHNQERNQGGSQLDNDYWEFDGDKLAWKRVHVRPRKRLYTPIGRNCPFESNSISSARETSWKCRGKTSAYTDDWQDGSANRKISSKSWVGCTWFFPKVNIDVDQAYLAVMKSNAAENLKRSPVKGAEAVAAILNDLESSLKGEEVPALIAQASEAFKQEKAASSACPRKQKSKGEPTLFEFCCEEDSMLGQVNEEHGINHFRLTQRNSDMTCPKQTESLKKLIGLFPGCDLWASIPCGPWSSLQHLNEARLGKEFKEALRKKRQRSRRILRNFMNVAEHVLAQGGHIGFEWPKNASGWALPELVQFIKRNGLYTAVTDGCAHGLKDKHGIPHLKPWRIVTSKWEVAENLGAKRCCHPKGFKHSKIEGSKTAGTARYPRPMAVTIIHSLYPSLAESIPAMPVMPFEQHEHAPNDAPPPTEEVYAAIHQLLDRKDWGKYPGAQECIDGEANGLIDNGTWNYEEVVPRKELLERKTPLNIGRLMTILSIKHWETPALRKLKARIVFRGDDIRDEANNLAILQELKVNPTGISGINFNLAYGAMKGNKSSQSDVIKAYTQSDLNTRVPTWVELPRELTPPLLQHIDRPCVRLWKSLYGHPESGFHWHRRFSDIMKQMGGVHSDLFQSTWIFKSTGQMLTLYVDDIVLSGPASSQKGFWDELQKHLSIEPPDDVDRVLGRQHIINRGEVTEMRHCMADYAKNACNLYEELSGRSLKAASTPFVADGSLLETDWTAKGQLSGSASRILMKCLWLARLSRPDIMKPLSDLTRRITTWATADDKRLYRLMCYLFTTQDYSIVHSMGDPPEKLRLSLYTDADHASDVEHAQSTSGMILCLEGENTFWPLVWGSRKQSATSRSTTEAEMISLCTGVFSEALPAQEFAEQLFGHDVTLQCFQDNSAVIQIVNAGYSPKLRHVSKTHRINLSSLYEVFEDPNVKLFYINTDQQRADIFTKALSPAKFPAALQLIRMESNAAK